jgi:hypothetical protein
MPEYRNVKLALEQAKHAKENTGLIDPMFDRIWAQALLENRQFGEAAPKALAAVGEGDEPAYGRLIAAIAYAELKDYENARTQLTMADAKRPSFTENGFLAHAKRDFFWIDTKDELDALRARAESLLAEGRTTTN